MSWNRGRSAQNSALGNYTPVNQILHFEQFPHHQESRDRQKDRQTEGETMKQRKRERSVYPIFSTVSFFSPKSVQTSQGVRGDSL